MNPLRPNFPPPATTTRPLRPEARAAQKAFFQAVVSAPAATTAARAEPVRAASRAERTVVPPEPEPQRYLRPGSLVDIKV